jgi:glycosyltransferase involved in cell wall biosynthesis
MNAATASAPVPVTVLLPVRNEAQNLPAALRSVSWAGQVIVVDSHSTDGTAELARRLGAEVVPFRYPGHGPRKKNWALATLPFRYEWVLLLDADERVTPALQAAIARAVGSNRADGYYLDRELVFLGRSLRCLRPNWNLRLFKHRLGRFEDLGLGHLPGTGDNEVHEHVRLGGRVGFLRPPLRHQDERDIAAWLERHIRYSIWEAHLYRRFRAEPLLPALPDLLARDPIRRRRVLRRVWVRLPCRPALRFFIWYVLRRGFLDGRAGLMYCLLMAWYELIIGLRLRAARDSEGAQP